MQNEIVETDGNDTVSSYSDLSDAHDEKLPQDIETKDAKDKKPSKKRAEIFPAAWAHKDLTPPELALGYALRQFCRVCDWMQISIKNTSNILDA